MLRMRNSPKSNGESDSGKGAAPLCVEGAGGDPRNGALGTPPSRVGSDLCAFVVVSSMGGDAARIISENESVL